MRPQDSKNWRPSYGGFKHGEASGGVLTPEYRAWLSMKKRCLGKYTTDFHLWGGRGITFCDRWKKFENFLADMGRKPSANHSLDRYPNIDGNYESGNCRWATAKEQRQNQHNHFRCKRGHERTPENLYKRGKCKTCQKIRNRIGNGVPF